MKNKRIIIIFSVLVFLALIVVLSGVLFRVETVEVNYSTSPILNIEKDEVYQKLNTQYKGTSIFFLNEKKLANKLEGDFANVKVLNIERKFPKKVYVTIQERIEVYCFEIDGQYVYTDYNCKVLRISKTKEELYVASSGTAINVKIDDKRIISSCSLGEIIGLKIYGATQFLTDLYVNTTNDPIFFRKYIHSIDLYEINISASNAQIKMMTGAVFNFSDTLNHSSKYIQYMNRLMENDPDTGAEIDRINGNYDLYFSGGEYYLNGVFLH